MSESLRAKDLYVVDRHQPSVFRFLEERFGDSRDVEVVWDRRRHERRATSSGPGAERRRADRRGPPADFLVSPGFIFVPAIERNA